MKTAYFDCSTGISGDMCLGALVDAGASLKKIERGLKGLPIKGYKIEAKSVKRAGIAATRVDVVLRPSAISSQQSAKKWKDIEKIIRTSFLSDEIKQKGLRIFRRLFQAEGKVHGRPYNRAHLHELGAVDCIVDVFGTLMGLELLGVDKVYSSSINLGSGSVRTEHGILSVPAPATAEILKEIPVYSSNIPFELTTPTGAAIVREVAEGFGNMPLMTVKNIGYGAGRKDFRESPNTLRIFLGEEVLAHPTGDLPKIRVIETNIDDMNPQLYEYVSERLFDSGALDVYLTQVIMKKGRPGVVMTVLCPEDRMAELIDLLFKETTTIGLRFYGASRVVLEREMREVETGFGRVRVKVSKIDEGNARYSPEYEDCKRIAKRHGIPLIDLMKQIKVE